MHNDNDHTKYNLGKVLLIERLRDGVQGTRWMNSVGGLKWVIINNQKVTRGNMFDFPIALLCSSRCFSIGQIQ